MPSSTRRLSPEERRAQLVRIGVDFLAERPLDELTIDALASAAGVSRALVFHYFDSRPGMHAVIVTTARDALLRATEPDATLPPRERVRDVLHRFVHFVREHEGTFYSLVRGVASADTAVRGVVADTRAANAQRLADVYLELGEVDTPLLQVALRSWVAFAEEALVELVIDTDTRAAEIVAFLERSLDGVVAATDTDRSLR
ncbi:TetR/AcrR family transcriptional regulator [Microbacterium gorillae]|uniref:TetR/AcrR family transcriptional regulator n=1 Tax=Microbacterium gorillae TaxID=1231063 RepID=UPI00058D05B2|nr:TetR/AcrR family transcriptional regulator [Microbacterium gorillae]